MAVIHADCLEAMAQLPESSVDAIVTDPPYGLEFMGKEWDRLWDSREKGGFAGGVSVGRQGPTYQAGLPAQEWHQRWATAALRVAKPGAYLLAFGGTRTFHRLACAIEDAGWIIRDTLVWGYASGFPKGRANLKPAWEPIVMARKPGPLRPLAIDECRIGTTREVPASHSKTPNAIYGVLPPDGRPVSELDPNLGRWPANVVLTDPIFDGDWQGVVGGGEQSSGFMAAGDHDSKGKGMFGGGVNLADTYGDTGTYSRFFLIPKAARSDREPNAYGKLVGGLDRGFSPTMGNGIGGREHDPENTAAYRQNVHPTVKPVELMRHLVRLVTPQGGTVLDPFLGSGTTAIAAEQEGFEWIGIEREAEYVKIAEARLAGVQRGMGLTG